MELLRLKYLVLASLLAALTAIGAHIHVPLGPVPIVLTNLFVLLAGLLLGGRWGAAAMGLYLFLGAIGMPVFAGAKGGLAHLFGPTGGYIAGFVAAAWITGCIAEKRRRLVTDIVAVLVGSLVVYLFGVPWLKFIIQMSWSKAVLVGMVPFLLGDTVKAATAVVITQAVRPVVDRQLQPALQ